MSSSYGPSEPSREDHYRSVALEHYAAVGRVIAGFHMVESELRQFLGRMITPDSQAALMITSEEQWSWVLRNLRVLSHYRITSDTLSHDFDDFLTRADKAAQERNRVTHDLWAPDRDESGNATLRRARIRVKGRKLKLEMVTLDAGDLTALADRLLHLWTEGAVFERRLEEDKALYPHNEVYPPERFW